jgi:hypothetical protein
MPLFWRKHHLNPKYRMDAAMLASNQCMESVFIRYYHEYETMIKERLNKLGDWVKNHREFKDQELVRDIYQIYLSKFNSRTKINWYKPADRFLDEEMIADLDALLAVLESPTPYHKAALRSRSEKPWAHFVTANFRRNMYYSLLGLGIASFLALPLTLPFVFPLFVTSVAMFWTCATLVSTLGSLPIIIPQLVNHHDFDILDAHNKIYELSLHLDASAMHQQDTQQPKGEDNSPGLGGNKNLM